MKVILLPICIYLTKKIFLAIFFIILKFFLTSFIITFKILLKSFKSCLQSMSKQKNIMQNCKHIEFKTTILVYHDKNYFSTICNKLIINDLETNDIKIKVYCRMTNIIIYAYFSMG
jgi:hypothetical protein